MFAAEGEDLVAEALRHGVVPEAVFSVKGAGLPFELPAGVEHVEAGAEALSAVSSLGSGSRVIGVFKQVWAALEDSLSGTSLYLYDVADPGNVGAVFRAAHAFGAGAVVLSERTADPFGPKAVRASMGAIFAVDALRGSPEEAAAGGARTVALVPGEGRPPRALDFSEPVLFFLGAERNGLPAAVIETCDEVANIPLAPGGAESLNVAMAATICLYESALHRLSAS